MTAVPILKTANMGFGHGKLILFGEHAVVYGTPAIVAGLNRGAYAKARRMASQNSRLSLFNAMSTPSSLYTRVDMSGQDPLAQSWRKILLEFDELQGGVEMEIQLDIPTGAGMGSSAAMAAAAARAIAQLLDGAPCAHDDARVERAVSASEAIFHGTASGIDQAAALNGGLFRFQRHETHAKIQPIQCQSGIHFAVCHAQSSASTAAMVRAVRQLHDRHTRPVHLLLDLIERVVDAAEDAIRQRDWSTLGELLTMNHGALVSLGVSTRELDEACHIARDAGALGAKLTGSGGGGCIIALTPHGADDVIEAWRACGYDGFAVTVGV